MRKENKKMLSLLLSFLILKVVVTSRELHPVLSEDKLCT